MRTFLFALPFLISLTTGAQNLLRGRITDSSTGEPVPGAVIYIHELKRGGVANIQGHYQIESLPKGKFLIETKMVGYASLVASVMIDGASELDFTLSGVVTELQEVVVTGVSHTTELKTNPSSVITIDSYSLLRQPSSNIIDNIASQPGVSQVTTGQAISKPVIRGLGYNRIITLFDGVRQEGQQWGDEHGIEIDQYSVDRVEILKGPGSLMYGSDGLGGVINFLPADPIEEGSIRGEMISNYQSNANLIGNSTMAAGNSSGLYWSARLSNKLAQAYKNRYDGRVYNSGFNETNWSGMVGKNAKWGYTQLLLSKFNQEIGLPEGERDTDGSFIKEINNNGTVEEMPVSSSDLRTYSIGMPRQEIRHFRVANTSNIYFGKSRIQLNAGYQRNKRLEFGNVIDEEEAELFFDLSTVNYNLIYFFPEWKEWTVSTGMGGMWQSNKNLGEEFLIPEYKLFDWGGFVYAKKHFNDLTFSSGIRYDIRNVVIDALYLDDNDEPVNDPNAFEKFAAADLSFSNFSASAGITYELSSRVNIKANISRGFRAPNLSELASNGQHEGSFRYEYGSYSLAPETSLQGDLSISLNGEHISAEFSVFKNSIKNYIYTQKLLSSGGGDSIPDPANPAPAYVYTQGNANLYGGELFIDIHPHPLDWLHIEHTFSFVHGENVTANISEDSRWLPFIPAPRYRGELRADFKKTGWLSSLYAMIEFDYTWTQNRVLLEGDTETPTDAYGLWNAGIGGSLKGKKGDVFRFHFTATNLFDKAYQNHLSRLKYAPDNPATGRPGIFNMGRNLSIKVIVPLTFKSNP